MLACIRAKLKGRLRRFVDEEHGTSTIEFVFMVPLFVSLLLLVTDASLLFLRITTLQNISRDTARIVSRYAMLPLEAQTYAVETASTKKAKATASVAVVNGFVTVILSVDARSAAPFGIISFAFGQQISATTISIMEPI